MKQPILSKAAPTASAPIKLENIEEMRSRVGIDDEELRDQIHGLKVGDHVCLTVCTEVAPRSAELVVVRIAKIGRDGYRGVLTAQPKAAVFSGLHAGLELVFAATHVHSVLHGHPPSLVE